MSVELQWGEGSVAELAAPNGLTILLVATATLIRAIHVEDGQVVIFKRPCDDLEQSKRRGLVYARAWLAGHVGVDAVYGAGSAQLLESDLMALVTRDE